LRTVHSLSAAYAPALIMKAANASEITLTTDIGGLLRIRDHKPYARNYKTILADLAVTGLPINGSLTIKIYQKQDVGWSTQAGIGTLSR